ncbi:hypothetical protein GS445_07550 [Rhodococcus hoagii]|nr:hypothetical protein [Prescottella equi]
MLDLAPYVQSWMDTLARQRPVFHSESDFQLALALVLADDVAQLRLEKKLSVSEPVGGRSRLSIDVLGELDGAPDRAGAEVPEEAAADECRG